MPCSYHFSGTRVLVCIFTGLYSLAETLAVFKAGLDDERSDGGVDVLIDITQSQAVKKPGDFQIIVHQLKLHPNFRGHIAVVPSRQDPLRYGLARQFSAMTSLNGVPMEVFGSISDALQWLVRDKASEESQ